MAGKELPNTGAGSSILILSLVAFGVIGVGVLTDAIRKRNHGDGSGIPPAITLPYNGGTPGVR